MCSTEYIKELPKWMQPFSRLLCVCNCWLAVGKINLLGEWMQPWINRKGEKPSCTGIIAYVMSLSSLYPSWQAWRNPEGKRGENKSHYSSALFNIGIVILILKKKKTEVKKNWVSCFQVTELVREEAISLSKCSHYHTFQHQYSSKM